jgi:pimeloyl-ACP methyl ester carboxylesterase
MRILRSALLCVALLGSIDSTIAREVTFATPDGGSIHADLYGETGGHGVVLAHGYGTDRTEWAAQAGLLAAEGCVVLAIDFRGEGESRGGQFSRSLYLGGRFFDVIGGIQYLQETAGVEVVSVIGLRMGAAIAAYATTKLEDPHLIGDVILLAPPPIRDPEKVPDSKLILLSPPGPSDLFDARVLAQFEELDSPKKLVVVGPMSENPALRDPEAGAFAEILASLAAE